jgi:hypothetical protein
VATSGPEAWLAPDVPAPGARALGVHEQVPPLLDQPAQVIRGVLAEAAAATTVRCRQARGSACKKIGVSRWLEWFATKTTGGFSVLKRARPVALRRA